MPIIERFKNLFRGQPSQAHRKALPPIVEHGTNPADLWEVLGDLGDGAFGKVEKVCRRDNPQQLAAAKGIEIEEDENLEDFLVEIEILSQCVHENIVGLLACYLYENKLSMMLEFCAGGAVDSIMIDLEKPLTEAQIAYVTRNVCLALEFLHENLVIHRDLKAGNILLTSDANVKLADFGVSAKMKDRNERRDSFIGTPYWMAPEVMLCETFKDQPYDTLADIWSLGITLIEMAQMDPPNCHVSPMRVVIKIQKSPPPTLEQPSKWSIYFNDFIARCLVKNPMERYTASNLLTHPFIKSAVDKKPLVQLLCEKNAEIQEEEIIQDDNVSADESAPESEEVFDSGSTIHSNQSLRFSQPSISRAESMDEPVEQPETCILKNSQRIRDSSESLTTPHVRDSSVNGAATKKFAAPKPPPKQQHEESQVKHEKYFGSSDDNEISTMSFGANSERDNNARNQWNHNYQQNDNYQKSLTPLKIDEPSFENETNPENNNKNSYLSSTMNNGPSSDNSMLSPSGKEAIEILDDLYNALDFDAAQGAHNPQARGSISDGGSTSRGSHPSPLMDSQEPWTIPENGYSHCNGPVKQTIRDIARESEDLSKKRGFVEDWKLERSKSEKIAQQKVNEKSRNYEPVRLRINMDEEEQDINRQRQSQPNLTMDIPEGLVKRNREIAQHEQMVDHSKTEAELIKEQRRRNDAAIFGNKITDQVSKIAASFTVRPPSVPFNTQISTDSRTTLQIRASDPTKHRSSEALEDHQRPLSMPSEASPREDLKSEISHYNSHKGDRRAQEAEEELDEQMFVEFDKQESQNEIFSDKSLQQYSNDQQGAFDVQHFRSSSTNDSINNRNETPAPERSVIGYSEDSISYSTEIPPPEPPVDYDQTPRPISNQRNKSEIKPTLSALKKEAAMNRLKKSEIATSPSPVSSRRSFGGGQPNSAAIEQNKSPQHKNSAQRINGAANNLVGTPSMSRKSPQRATVTKKTRTYVVDGIEVTSTTLHVLGVKQDFELRKKEMQDLKRMQREEARQQQELNSRADQLREQQERKFLFEKQAVHKAFEGDIEAVSRTQKKKMEEMERSQEEELRSLVKKIRVDQERDLRIFKERLRQEQKIMKQEVDMLPKSQRKDVYQHRKEILEKVQFDRETEFLVQLERNQELYLNRTREKHREKMALMERQFLEQKHQLERSMQSALWELEERQLAEKHNLLTQQFRDVFHLQRTHMLGRHHKELEHIKRINQANEENMLRALTADRKGMPKALRNESKTRSIMFKESLRIDLPDESVERWAEKIHQFEEKEKQRIRAKMDEYDLKCKRKLAQLVAYNQNMVKELEEIHNEKRSMLVDNERSKLGEYEKEYQQLLKEWKTSLPNRKASLEAKFAEELENQERFYNVDGAGNHQKI